MERRRTVDQVVEAYAWWVLRWRWPILILTIVATVLAARGGGFLTFSTNYRAFFSKANPQLATFEALQDIYTKNDNILFVLAPEDGQVFTGTTLNAVEHLTREAWKLPYAMRVDSVTNFQHTRADGDDLIVADLVTEALNQPPEALTEAQQVALREPLLLDRLIPPATHVTGVNVTLQLPGKNLAEVTIAAAKARQLAAEIREAHPGMAVYLTGVTMLNNAFSESSRRDMSQLLPIMYLAMLIIMFWLLRSISGTVATLLVIAFSAAGAMGLAGWTGLSLTGPSAQAPTMIMTLAVADSIHILVIMLREMRQGLGKREALVESLRLNMQPVFLTSLTTAIGFLSMNFSDAPPFRHLGNITATGVGLAFVHSVLFLPAFMSLLPVRVKPCDTASWPMIDRVGEFVVRRHRAVLWVSAPIVVMLALWIPRNELNDQFVNYFNKSIAFRTDTDFAMENLASIMGSATL
ncbi:efflux RND transporter permease subunit [Candidatus Entotheonella palauensis]|uniref:efflux RND transporter permease subunit n=1 Tax=Candidatus Entotheonella palauensis TaxID=93172 RepID=UPI000B7E9F75|nr:MMPL family transporter [Candidatus Entotheonella palauensis]